MNNNEELIEEYCMRENYLSYDPYDIWKTQLGIISKRLFFKNKYLGLPFVSLLTLLDFYIINKKRFFYKKKEYPIVSAQNTIVLLNKLKKTKNKKYLEKINKNIDWLLNNYSKKYKGLSWGTGFKIVISSNVVYDEQTPFTTNTPYILEAFDLYYNETKSEFIVDKIKKIYEFYEICLRPFMNFARANIMKFIKIHKIHKIQLFAPSPSFFLMINTIYKKYVNY